MRRSPIAHIALVATVLSLSSPLPAQLTLVEEGGALTEDDIALAPAALAFAIDSLAGFPQHNVVGLNDGIYGNRNSWIGNSGSPGFAGIDFGGRYTVSSIAFGRDNSGTYGDRCLGVYTLQYTTEDVPNEWSPDDIWITVGTIQSDPVCPPMPWVRHRYNFAPVEATGIRLLVPGTGITVGTCIDELEAYSEAGDVLIDPCVSPPLLELIETGGPITTPAAAGDVLPFESGNLARSPAAVPFGTPPYPIPAHTVPHLNDGSYGNENSWLGNELGPWSGQVYAGVYLTDGLHEIHGIALGRDNTGQYWDRTEGTHTIEYTEDELDPEDESSTGWANWIALGTAGAHLMDASRGLRHAYAFSPVQARAVRVVTLLGNAIDEIELLSDEGEPPAKPLFHRSDANDDGRLNITDGIFILNFLFLGGPEPSCLESANANDDETVNITDGIHVLNYLFLGGPSPADPAPDGPCGPEPPGSPSDLGCESHRSC